MMRERVGTSDAGNSVGSNYNYSVESKDVQDINIDFF